MTSLITILISLLGYGSPSDYEHYTEAELQTEIAYAQEVDGGFGDWDTVE